MKNHSKIFYMTTLVLALFSLASPATAQEVRIVDGDTIAIDNIRHRLNGIDAPEQGQTCNAIDGSTWNCGQAATREMNRLLQLGDVECISTTQGDYGRELSTCWVAEINMNEHMVQNGFAWAFRKYSKKYVSIENVARIAKRGIWQAPTQTAWDFRSQRWAAAEQEAPEGCPIKGNISKNGYIYHTPWSPWYDRTRINEDKGERWFCNETEALAAGWRAAIWN